jgi:hypothetical protein
MTMQECDKCHYPHQLNQEYYKRIKTFKGERIINAPIHTRELQTKGDANCMLREYWKLTYKMIKISQSYSDICLWKNL